MRPLQDKRDRELPLGEREWGERLCPQQPREGGNPLPWRQNAQTNGSERMWVQRGAVEGPKIPPSHREREGEILIYICSVLTALNVKCHPQIPGLVATSARKPPQGAEREIRDPSST